MVSRSREEHRLHVPPRSVEGELRRRAAGFGRRGGERVQLCSGGQHHRRQRGRGEGGVAVGRSQRGNRRRGAEGPAEERSVPVVFKDLDGQRGDERQQPVGDVSQNQLLVGVTADPNVGGASLKQKEFGSTFRCLHIMSCDLYSPNLI